jgi:xanthine dehydrogenase YagS FAD-binding subunit
MQTFEWIDATSVDHAATLLKHGGIAKAGGIDLLDLMKEGIVAPARLVNLKLIKELRGIRCDSKEGLHLGALTTLAEIASHPGIHEHYGALTASAAHAATPQVRNVATIGGNLLQRPRCWYFRNAHFHREQTIKVEMQEREHQYHAIFDNATTAMVHASTLATALIAYGASVHLSGHGGRSRRVLLNDFLLPPDIARDRDATIERGEIVTHITVPLTSQTTRSIYHKQTERESYDWSIFDIAVVLVMRRALVESATIVIGGVAPTPMRALTSEALINGKALTESLANEAATLAVRGATPFKSNAYKVPMLEVVLRRTLLGAVA